MSFKDNLIEKLSTQDKKVEDLTFLGLNEKKIGVCMIGRADNVFHEVLINRAKEKGFKFDQTNWILSSRYTDEFGCFLDFADALDAGAKYFAATAYKVVNTKGLIVSLH